MTRIETSSSWYDWVAIVSCSSSQIQKFDAMVGMNRNLEDEFRGALIEAKESIEGKRKLNTLDNLITELRETVDEGEVKGSGD